MGDNQGNDTKKQSNQSLAPQIPADDQENAIPKDSDSLLSEAKRLLQWGKLNEVEVVLQEAVAYYPTNEAMFQQLYDFYKKRHEWLTAKQMSEKLVEINTQKATFYFQLGRSFAFLKETDAAKEAYIAGLQKRHQLVFKDIIAQVTQDFPQTSDRWTSEYMYIKGKNNYGALFHTAEDKQYMTKIVKYNHNAKREALFYKDVCVQFPLLQNMAPAILNAKNMNRILYLNTKWIEGEESTLQYPEEIIGMSHRIASIPSSQLLYTYGRPEYLNMYFNNLIDRPLLFNFSQRSIKKRMNFYSLNYIN